MAQSFVIINDSCYCTNIMHIFEVLNLLLKVLKSFDLIAKGAKGVSLCLTFFS